MSATWRPAVGAEPWLELSGGTLTPGKSGATFHANAAKALGFDVGKVGAAFTANDATVALGFGEDDVSNAPVRISVAHALPQPTADIELSPVDLAKLAGPFGVKLPIKDVVASGKAHLVFERADEPKPITGTLSAKLQGFIPPHPRELDGFVFGDSTTLQSAFTVAPDRKNVTLSETTVAAGAFKLAGSGSIERQDDHARIRMNLTGNLPCDALAGAAAETHLGSVLGKIAGAVAKQTLKGSVGVTVKLDADTRDLENAKLERIIGVGCGLKPLDFSKIRPEQAAELAATAAEQPAAAAQRLSATAEDRRASRKAGHEEEAGAGDQRPLAAVGILSVRRGTTNPGNAQRWTACRVPHRPRWNDGPRTVVRSAPPPRTSVGAVCSPSTPPKQFELPAPALCSVLPARGRASRQLTRLVVQLV